MALVNLAIKYLLALGLKVLMGIFTNRSSRAENQQPWRMVA